jgi:hypothetical protein
MVRTEVLTEGERQDGNTEAHLTEKREVNLIEVDGQAEDKIGKRTNFPKLLWLPILPL